MSRSLRVLVLYNLATELTTGTIQDLICEQEIAVIAPLVISALAERGYSVSGLKASTELWNNLREARSKVDLVFNLAEGFGGRNGNEPLIPSMLEALGIPFTGASAHNMYLTLDKEKTKLVVAGYGVRTARSQVFRTADDALDPALGFPLIVKPIRQEASIGIDDDSVVTTVRELGVRVARILDRYGQPALAEAFVAGREISVGILGNVGSLEVLPALEFLFDAAMDPLRRIRSYSYKWGGTQENMVKASLDADLEGRLRDQAALAFVATECRDYARMDFRIAADLTPYLLEVNYNPGIGPNTHGLNNTLTMMASFTGLAFEDLIERVVTIAAVRAGLLS